MLLKMRGFKALLFSRHKFHMKLVGSMLFYPHSCVPFAPITKKPWLAIPFNLCFLFAKIGHSDRSVRIRLSYGLIGLTPFLEFCIALPPSTSRSPHSTP